MSTAENGNAFIPGIYNYCDRWCERCQFTARCRTFAMESQFEDAGHDGSIESTLEIVRESFAEAKRMLVEKAEEMGIDIEAAANDPEVEKSIERTKRTVEDQPVFELSKRYALDLVPVMRSLETVIETGMGNDPTVNEMIEIIGWYQFLITGKIHGALHSLVDFDGVEDLELLKDPQSDANGRAKVALIAVERSVLAWTYLLTDKNASTIRPFIEMLEHIARMVEEKFPNSRAFVRPGFDEIETIM